MGRQPARGRREARADPPAPLGDVTLELRDPAVVAWAAATPAARVAAIGWDYAVGGYPGHGVVGQVVRTVKPGGVSGTRTKARYRRRARASPALVAGHRPQRGEVLAALATSGLSAVERVSTYRGLLATCFGFALTAPRPKVPVGPAAVPHLMALAPTFLATRPEDDLRFTLRTLIDALASHARRSGRDPVSAARGIPVGGGREPRGATRVDPWR